jgi:hypothetical protein
VQIRDDHCRLPGRIVKYAVYCRWRFGPDCLNAFRLLRMCRPDVGAEERSSKADESRSKSNQTVGTTFAFSRNRLVGSYLFLTLTRRS